MSEAKREAKRIAYIKFTTTEGDEFFHYCSEEEAKEIVRRAGDMCQIDILEEMTEEEYRRLPITPAAVEFFGRGQS